jgi:uncharacterized UBP type Zn finger protein
MHSDAHSFLVFLLDLTRRIEISLSKMAVRTNKREKREKITASEGARKLNIAGAA